MAPRTAATQSQQIYPKPTLARLTQKPSYEGGQSEACPPFSSQQSRWMMSAVQAAPTAATDAAFSAADLDQGGGFSDC
jgi:hypothetical protein